ncbi:MAG: phosphate/phosphite/phosphonate ABC transporter substrate-binding protein [Bacillota bacterium]
MKKKRAFSLLAGLLAFSLLFLAGCGRDRSDSAARVLRVGLIPNQAPDKIKAQYEPFRDYLSKKTGMDVELFVATDYTGVVEAMAGDKLDLAYFGGLTYVQARKKADIYPIVTEIDRYTKTTKYSSLIIVPADSPIKSLSQLKGKTFAFGDVSSTSGSLYPRIMLDKAGIKVPGDLKSVVYTGSHDATALAVQNKTVDAGGVEGRILKKMIDKGTVDQSRIRVLLESDPIEGYPWVVRGKLDKVLVERIVQAFLEINDPALLDLMRAERYEKIDAGSYDYVEMEASRLGLLKN